MAEMACGQPVRSCWTLTTNTLVFFQGTSKSACALLVLPLSGAGNLTYSQNTIQINSPLTLTPDSYPRNFFFFWSVLGLFCCRGVFSSCYEQGLLSRCSAVASHCGSWFKTTTWDQHVQTFHSKVKESEVTQSCPTLCDPMDCSLAGSSVHGIFQARVLEWVAISFSRRSSRPRD